MRARTLSYEESYTNPAQRDLIFWLVLLIKLLGLSKAKEKFLSYLNNSLWSGWYSCMFILFYCYYCVVSW